MSSRGPHATIFADASWCRVTHAAGWGAWMIGGGKPSIFGGGPIRERIDGATQAELIAMANALHVAAKAGYLAKGASIMLQSDCVNMLGFLRAQFGAVDAPMKDREHGVPTKAIDPKCWGRPGRRGVQVEPGDPPMIWRRKGLQTVGAVVEAWELKLIVRHVRGHRNQAAADGDGRAWVNKRVDEIAYKGMLKARLALTGTNIETGDKT